MGESYEPEKVIKMIRDTLKDLSITSEELERKKKVLKSVVQFRSDNIYAMNSKINNNSNRNTTSKVIRDKIHSMFFNIN